MHRQHIKAGIGGLFCDPSQLRIIRLMRICVMLALLQALRR